MKTIYSKRTRQMKLFSKASFFVFLFLASTASAQSQRTGFLDRSIEVEGSSHRYQVYVPEDYDSSQDWPVILFLHGAGERGNDGLKQSTVGLGNAIRQNPERWPAITIFPQVPTGESWQGIAADVAMAALDATIANYSVDESRQYLTGLSLGGNGTWYLGYKHTERFAAMVAVCGFVGLGDRFPTFVSGSANPYADLAEDLQDTPIWIVHGDADVVVPVEESRKMFQQLNALGAEVHYTELPGINHNSWDAAYGNQELNSWLFQQSLN
jgi:predicted peptidase